VLMENSKSTMHELTGTMADRDGDERDTAIFRPWKLPPATSLLHLLRPLPIMRHLMRTMIFCLCVRMLVQSVAVFSLAVFYGPCCLN